MPNIITVVVNLILFLCLLLMFRRRNEKPRNRCFQCKKVVRQTLENGDGYWSCNGQTIVLESLEPIKKNCFIRG